MNYLNFTKTFTQKDLLLVTQSDLEEMTMPHFWISYFYSYFRLKKKLFNTTLAHSETKIPYLPFLFQVVTRVQFTYIFCLSAFLGVRQTNVFQVTRLNTENQHSSVFGFKAADLQILKKN